MTGTGEENYQQFARDSPELTDLYSNNLALILFYPTVLK
jgi:hypothetical protein